MDSPAPHPDLAAHVAAILDNAGLASSPLTVEPVGHGMSGDLVAIVTGVTEAVVKTANRARSWNLALLQREIGAIRWLAGRGAPRILWTGEQGTHLVLITERLAGTAVSHVPPQDAPEALAATARALAVLHGLDATGCGLDQTLATKLALARGRVEGGLVDPAEFDAKRQHFTAAAAFEPLLAATPPAEDLVFAHGDASLPNFIWSPGQPVGLVDLGLAGPADRYQDLALFLRSAARNHPQVDARAILRANYPVGDLDEAKVDFYRLLDEFF
jgi:aminoglycoside phosphotransferase